jgi:TonB family protein
MRRMLFMGLATAVAAGSLALHAQAQAPLAHIRDLYSSAAYEDVLSAIAADPTGSPQIGQYKVFSLIALGRTADADKAAEAVLLAHLDFHLDSDASPRLIELFANTRRRIAPDLLKLMYANAKGLLDNKDRDGAIAAFTEVLTVASDPDLKDDKTVADLGLLANGFLELSRALPAAARPPVAADAATAKHDAPAASPDRPSAGAARSVPIVSPPQPLHQDLPRWSPPASLARAEFKGRILVHVDVDGKVESAKILNSVQPLYDQQLLSASRGWLYKPGQSNGAPVPSDYIVEVVLRPRQDL